MKLNFLWNESPDFIPNTIMSWLIRYSLLASWSIFKAIGQTNQGFQTALNPFSELLHSFSDIEYFAYSYRKLFSHEFIQFFVILFSLSNRHVESA